MPDVLSGGETELPPSTWGLDEAGGRGSWFSFPSQYGSRRALVGRDGVVAATPCFIFLTTNDWVVFTLGEGLALLLVASGIQVDRLSSRVKCNV